MPDVEFPQTAEEFDALRDQGLTVQYAETDDPNTPPQGDGWQYWRDRVTPEGTVAVWRRIAPIAEVYAIAQ